MTGPDADLGPVPPDYGTRTLSAVLPGAAAALGVDTGLAGIAVPATDRVCVVLIDGLGARLLADHADTAPFLAGLLAGGQVLGAGCPTTTATSLGSLGTGLPPGTHGLIGYEVLDPDRDVLLNHLSWHPDVDPDAWQPNPTVFERLGAQGIAVTSIGNPEFQGSGFTRAALRGADFSGAAGLAERVEVAIAALARPGLVYLYWGAVDAAGHEFGCRTKQWRRELSTVDQNIEQLASELPAGTVLLVIADHGMVDVPHETRIDLADWPALSNGVRLLGGDPRLAQLYCRPGRADEVARRFLDAVGEQAWVRTRAEAVAQGWFGQVQPSVLERIGDVIVAAREPFALVDSRSNRPELLSIIGQHGSLTADEQEVPLLLLRT